jgi:hypothetical protein
MVRPPRIERLSQVLVCDYSAAVTVRVSTGSTKVFKPIVTRHHADRTRIDYYEGTDIERENA